MSKSMMIYGSDWYTRPTFRMVPVSNDCPFNEVIYDPNAKMLAIVSKDRKEKPQMLVKLDNDGNGLELKRIKDPKQRYAEERRIMDAYYEYYIGEKNDIKAFIEHFAINPEHAALAALDAVEPEAVTA